MKNFVKLGVVSLTLSLFFYSCNKEDAQLEDQSSNVITEEVNQVKKIFFDKEKTFELLQPVSGKWRKKHGGVQLRTNPEELNKAISFVEELDGTMDEKYAGHVIDNFGYPFWDGYELYNNSENENFTIVIPIFESNSTEINALFTYSESENDKVSYSLMSKSEMIEIASNPEDRNFHFYTEVFQDFDIDLFDNSNVIYDDWSSLAVNNNNGCYVIINCKYEGGPCYELCATSCTDQLWDSGIVDTSTEEAWVTGNCQLASVIDQFLDDNGTGQIYLEASQFLLDVGLGEVLGNSSFNSLKGAMDDYLVAPDNQTNIEAFYDYFEDNDLDILAVDLFHFTDQTILPDATPPSSGDWVDFVGNEYFSFTTAARADLLAQYQTQTQTINDFWACRVLGVALERVALNAIGFPQGNTMPGNFTKNPDGYKKEWIYDIWGYEQPRFIEVKGKFAFGTPVEYHYTGSQPAAQFTAYRQYLSSIINTHKPTTTVIQGLFMVLPANVSLSNSVKTACSNSNIPLLWAGTQRKVGTNPILVRLTRPELLNIDGLDRSDHLIGFMPNSIFKWALEENWERYTLSYQEEYIDFDWAVSKFEQDYLIPNIPVSQVECEQEND